jgi:hypothetical protein
LAAPLGWIALQWSLKAAGLVSTQEAHSMMLGSGIAMSIIVFFVAWCGIWLLRKESFAYTHYPMRFNRKTRMVHVFRTNGTILSVPWDQIFFTLGCMPPMDDWEVRGHVLDADGVTVRETFALSYVGDISAEDARNGAAQFSSDDFVRAHWEFIRRYMEDGPQLLTGQVEFCMPVDVRRERLWMGVQRVFANIGGAPRSIFVTLAPWCASVSLFRAIAMRTSKIPQWPAEIEAANFIVPQDPYAIVGDEEGKRVPVFPEAAHKAGAVFVAPPGSARAGSSEGLKSNFRKK